MENNPSPVVLNVVKLSQNASLNFPHKKTNVLTEGVPFWIWPDNGKVIASVEKPVDSTFLPSYRELKRYNIPPPRKQAGVMLPVPTHVRDKAGLKPNDYVSVTEKGNQIIIEKATKKQIDKYVTKKPKKPAVEGEIRGGRYLRLTPEAKTQLGINRGDNILITINVIDGVWMEISKAPANCNLGGINNVFYHDYGRYLTREPMVFSFTIKYVDMIFMPTYFLDFAKVPETNVDTLLPHWFDGDKLILEGLPWTCSCCGKTYSTYKNKNNTLKSCSKCLTELDMVKSAVTSYGNLDNALNDPNSDLSVYITGLADKANNYIENYAKGNK